jgi:hypothetical protein
LSQPEKKSKYPTETIPEPDLVSRCIFFVDGTRLDPLTDFKFSGADHAEHPLTLSGSWRKYAPARYEIEQRGEFIADFQNARNKKSKKMPLKIMKYAGFRTATAQTIRGMRTGRDFGFAVVHHPDDYHRAHTHITITHEDHPNGPSPMKNDLVELKQMLVDGMPVDEEPEVPEAP